MTIPAAAFGTISSWGKIDFSGIVNINPRTLLLDFLLISVDITLAWTVFTGLRKGLAQAETFRWAVLLCIGYALTFLFAFLMCQWHTLDLILPTPPRRHQSCTRFWCTLQHRLAHHPFPMYRPPQAHNRSHLSTNCLGPCLHLYRESSQPWYGIQVVAGALSRQGFLGMLG